MNYTGKKLMLGLSGGINSAAVLCWLIESGMQPEEVHIFYAHFAEHSPDTFQFVADGIRLARKHFKNVVVKITSNHVLRYFEEQNMIPHPASSPCSKNLKALIASKYAFDNGIFVDLVGYVKHELKRRSEKIKKHETNDLFSVKKHFPIGSFTDRWCFDIVKRNIGWYPKIYNLFWDDGEFIEWLYQEKADIPDAVWLDIEKRIGKHKRVFTHNNCLPCKNMYSYEILAVKFFFPEYYLKSMAASSNIKRYYGRNADEFYSTFGRDIGQESTCSVCTF